VIDHQTDALGDTGLDGADKDAEAVTAKVPGTQLVPMAADLKYPNAVPVELREQRLGTQGD
jgi:hypothetical protein